MILSHIVAIITRTKDRPILLGRALSSVGSQSFRHFQWIIVNDGGDTEPVNKVVVQAQAAGIDVVVIHHPKSQGMEAASNSGIRATESEFVVIHDDDDTWDPVFLERCVSFLRQNESYAGVVTQCMKIEETVHCDRIEIIRKYDFNPWLQSVYLVDLAKVNAFPPISFLYRRHALETVGLYDESLPVLGDWDFNLRFVAKFDIGVIPEPFANYHHRSAHKSSNDVYGNSLYAGRNKHIEFDAIVRNRLLRRDLEEGKAGLGFLVALGRIQQASLAEQFVLKLGRFAQRLGLSRRLLKL